MDLLVEPVDVRAATIQDRPGALAQLLTALREAGADLRIHQDANNVVQTLEKA